MIQHLKIRTLIKTIIAIFFFSIGFAQGPKSPEASSFEPIDAADMVGLLNGDFSYVLPLIDIPGPEGGYPIALSYHGGIGMAQEASWSGLGWTVNPGAINRNVNGIPDDWKRTKKYQTIYNQGGSSTSYSFAQGVGYKHFSFARFLSYTENKTFGGENSYSFDGGIRASFGLEKTPLNISGSLGTGGVGIGVGYTPKGLSSTQGSLGVSVHKSFKNGKTTLKASGSFLSLGVSLSTNGTSSYLNAGIRENSISAAGSSGSNSLSFKNDAFSLYYQHAIAFVEIGYRRSRYWLFDMKYSTHNGSLYAGDMSNLLDEELFDWKVGFDSYQAHNQNHESTSFGFMGYDAYSVSGQGMSGQIQPRVFEEGVLYHQQETLNSSPSGGANSLTAYHYPNTGNNGVFNNSLSNYNFHFYFNNENSSYLKIKSDNWNTPVPGSSYNDVFAFNTTNQTLESDVVINGITYNGYNNGTKRKRAGSNVEVFTNQDIKVELNGINLINFIEAKGINRNQSHESFPDDGIGGYRITALDGKTYHYSLPVYQKETFRRATNKDKNPVVEFIEESQLEPYATHWLLTAITGPDFVDANNNFEVDEQDYGYWVEFQYGKWSDGYTWRNPVSSGYEFSTSTKGHSWGVKEMYYLDKIKTRTHTALFIKKERQDNLSSSINIGNVNNPQVYPDNHINSFEQGDDGNYYIAGVYDKFDVVLNGSPITNFLATSEHTIYVKTNLHKTLALSKIILLDNDNPYANISKSNSNESAPILSAEIKIHNKFWVRYNGGSLYADGIKEVHNETWNGEFFGNVIDEVDISTNAIDIEEGAIKVIDFNHSYNSMHNSPNSISSEKGRLTLESMSFRGENGVGVIPDYNFEYNSPETIYDNENKDEWGFNLGNPVAWSLNKIVTPVGETLNIIYEADDYHEEAAITNFVFGEKFAMKFTGQESGNKFVQFTNKGDSNDIIDFRDYFTFGEYSKVDIQYVYDPGNGADRIADVNKLCLVQAVTSYSVTFLLPASNLQSGERKHAFCHADDWVFYQRYNGDDSVVERTTLGVGEYLQNDCNEVNNGEHKTKIKFYSSKKYLDEIGGGIRVKELSLQNDDDTFYKTSYDYKTPDTNTSSGITSYSPSKRNKEVKFGSEIPGASVMYEYVTVTNTDSQDVIYSKDIYHFNTIKPMILVGSGFNMGSTLSLTSSQDSFYPSVAIDNKSASLRLTKFNLVDNLSSIGRLVSKTSLNAEDQVLLRTTNDYSLNSEIKQGITQETFKTYKRVSSDQFSNNPKYFISSSSKISYPNILKSTTIFGSGYRNVTNFKKLDFLTGDFTEVENLSSKGDYFKTKKVSAYSKYTLMGSKADNSNNKNMLSQEAASYTFIEHNGVWKPISVGIQTWKNNWSYTDYKGITTSNSSHHNIWRKHKNYIWDGGINSLGLYVAYSYDENSITGDDGFIWNDATAEQPAPWKLISETMKYNHFSMPIEIKDINGNRASTKMTDNESKVLLSSNARYGEAFFSGFEYTNLPNNYFDQQIQSNHSYQSSDKAHTGDYSLKLMSGQFVTIKRATPSEAFDDKKDIVSVWVHKENWQNAKIQLGSGSITSFNGEKVFAGNWVQLNHYVDASSTTTDIKVRCTGSQIYIDDLRMHPIASSMTSYVYNKYDELTFMLGSNNLATKYQYDAAGRLIWTYQETIDSGTITGGFKKAAQYRYNYKRDLNSGTGSCNPSVVKFSNKYYCDNEGASFAKLTAPIGARISINVTGSNTELLIDNVPYTSGIYEVTSANPIPIFSLRYTGANSNGASSVELIGSEDECFAIIGTIKLLVDVNNDDYQLCDPNPYSSPSGPIGLYTPTETIDCLPSQSGGTANQPYQVTYSSVGVTGLPSLNGSSRVFEWAYRLYLDGEINEQIDFISTTNSGGYTFDPFCVGPGLDCPDYDPSLCNQLIQVICRITYSDGRIYVVESNATGVNCSCTPG